MMHRLPPSLARRSLRVRRCVAAVVAGLAVLAVAAPAIAAASGPEQWHLDFLHVAEAQHYSQGDGTVVGLVDTGVDATHADLVGSILPGFTVPPLVGDPLTDSEGHGTAMAGLIAAHGRVHGIAPRAKILPVLAMRTYAGHSSPGGVRWAVDHGATVLCLAYSAADSSDARSEIAYAIDHDVVVVAGIGNVGTSPDLSPADYPGVVAAAGVDRNGNHSAVSVTGPYATLAAPSDDIVSTDTLADPSRTGYSTGTGTSNSTAIIAGAAALVRAKFPK